MQYIQLKYKGKGKRTVNVRTHGFMGPARSPLGKGPMKVGFDYLRPGTLTTAFQLTIPPNGECQVVDCQHNRELLRKLTKSRSFYEDVKVFNEETGKYVSERQKLVQEPGWEVISDTPIHEDIVPEPTVGESAEISKLKSQIKEMETKLNGGVEKTNPAATPTGETVVPMEDEPEPLTAEELKNQRFSNKVEPVDNTPISLV